MNLTIDFVIENCLIGIYSDNILAERLYLKGGQALRVKEKLKDRFSADMDFSIENNITTADAFFEMLEKAITGQFFSVGYCAFDFSHRKQPRVRADGTPDFWSGWAFDFKLVEEKKRNLSLEQKRREAITPVGANTSRISLDISEYEYCESAEKVKVGAVSVKTYSRTSLLLEKLRAICQSHHNYPYTTTDRDRSRDFYDIERLYNVVLESGKVPEFLRDCAVHLPGIFAAKRVALGLLDEIFEPSFIRSQNQNWESVISTVKGRLQPFDYYVDSLKYLVREIRANLDNT